MKLNFYGDVSELNDGIEILSREINFTISKDGLPVKVKKRNGNMEINFTDGKGTIEYEKKIHFFRALGLLIQSIKGSDSDFEITEEPQFDMNGVMLDVSRNAVLKIESIKTIIRKMALMGLDMIMLYTEDTYTIDDKPYFGYMRGRYSHEELKECDDYAEHFGIEMIPCIQTLGHLTQALKWNYAKDIKDTDDILLVGEEKTYEFIDEMIKSVSSVFRSSRIHIGMDEAHGLGLGRYLEKNGYCKRFDIMNEHLKKVVEITKNYKLKPMIWSDMYFRFGSKTGDYYDLDAYIPEDVMEKVPKDVKFVYWDYYHEDEQFYIDYIRRHRKLGSDPMFAGGIWTWVGPGTNYSKTFKTTNAGLNACKKEKIKEVIATIWGDNGAENNYFSALLGLQLFAEHGYAKKLDMEKLRERFEFCTKGKYDAFEDLKNLDEIPFTREDKVNIAKPPNPSKYLLWQDILIGLFDSNIKNLDISSHYEALEKKMKNHKSDNEDWDFVFEVPLKLCRVLSLKSDIGLKLKQFYDINNKKELKKILKKHLPELKMRVIQLKNAHRDQWHKAYKPFGWEVIDVRYGGLLARIDTAIKRLSDYNEGRIQRIEELEEERLRFDIRNMTEGVELCHCHQYNRIVSASEM